MGKRKKDEREERREGGKGGRGSESEKKKGRNKSSKLEPPFPDKSWSLPLCCRFEPLPAELPC